MIQLSQLKPKLNKYLSDLEKYSSIDKNFEIDFGGHLVHLNVRMDIKSQPDLAYRAEVSIMPYEENTAKVIAEFFKPISNDSKHFAKEKKQNFTLIINKEKK